MQQEATGKTGAPSPKRQKPERPRDRLGRPLDWDADGDLDLPDFDSKTLEENHELARGYLAQAHYFAAHEAWETAWKQTRGTGDEELFKGLSQMGAGYVHLLRGNAHGAVTLLGRAARRIGGYPDGHWGIECQDLAERLERDAARVSSGELSPGEGATFDPPAV